MEVAIRNQEAGYLANFVRGAGYIVTFGEALRAIDRFQGNVQAAYQFLAEYAPRFQSTNTVSRFQRKFDMKRPGSKLLKQQKKKNNVEGPVPGGNMEGANITLGSYCGFSKDYLRYGYMLNKSLGDPLTTRTGRFLCKGFSSYADNPKYFLNSIMTTRTTPAYPVTNTYRDLPMYAFNLSAMPWTGATTTNNTGQWCTIPFYRLSKLGNLAQNSQQYVWLRQQMTVNQASQPDENVNAWSYVWNRKSQTGLINATPLYRHEWTHVKLLLQCGFDCDCTVHTDIVQFKNRCGPIREIWENNGTATLNKTVTLMDDALDSTEYNSNDVFWENFWAHRVVHPLAEFVNPDKDQYIKYLSKGSINIQPRPTDHGQNVRHLRDIFYKNGRIYSLKDEAQFDQTNYGSLVGQNAINNPVVATGLDADKDKFPNYTNMVENNHHVLPYNRDQSQDVWLLIYADMLPRQAASSACRFDFTAESKVQWLATGSTTVQPFKNAGNGTSFGPF